MSFTGCKLKYAFDEKNKNVVIGQNPKAPEQDVNKLWKEKLNDKCLFLPKQYQNHFGRNNHLTRKEYNNLVTMNKMKQTDEMWKRCSGNSCLFK